MSGSNKDSELMAEIHEELEKLLRCESMTDAQKIAALYKIIDESSTEIAR